MARKIEMSKEEQQLYNELQKLVKRANQRLVRIEKLTGESGLFASKQLYDYLDSSTVQALTPASRIKISKTYDLMKLKAIKKATEQFLESDLSRVKGIKELTKTYSEKAGKTISYEQADVLYQSGRHYSWIIGMKGLTESEFWGNWVPLAKRGDLTKDEWIVKLAERIDVELDEYYKEKLENIYYYVIG